MHLSWNEVRARAAVFAEDWKDAAYLRRWTARTEADYPDPDRPIRYRFFLYRLKAFFRSLDLETWHDGLEWRDRGPLS